jgi:hypothetical protein
MTLGAGLVPHAVPLGQRLAGWLSVLRGQRLLAESHKSKAARAARVERRTKLTKIQAADVRAAAFEATAVKRLAARALGAGSITKGARR